MCETTATADDTPASMPRPAEGPAVDPTALEPVDEIEITTLGDNVFDALLPGGHRLGEAGLPGTGRGPNRMTAFGGVTRSGRPAPVRRSLPYPSDLGISPAQGLTISQVATAVTVAERLPMMCGRAQGKVIESFTARVTISDSNSMVSSPSVTVPTS